MNQLTSKSFITSLSCAYALLWLTLYMCTTDNYHHQVGIPSDREQYIHRLGRTGRGGKEGEGILLIAPWEEYFLNDLKDLPLDKLPSPCLDPEIQHQVCYSLSCALVAFLYMGCGLDDQIEN